MSIFLRKKKNAIIPSIWTDGKSGKSDSGGHFMMTDFLELSLLISFARKRKVFRRRANHFRIWNDKEFYDRFRLSKYVVKYVLSLIEDKISTPTTRYLDVIKSVSTLWSQYLFIQYSLALKTFFFFWHIIIDIWHFFFFYFNQNTSTIYYNLCILYSNDKWLYFNTSTKKRKTKSKILGKI